MFGYIWFDQREKRGTTFATIFLLTHGNIAMSRVLASCKVCTSSIKICNRQATDRCCSFVLLMKGANQRRTLGDQSDVYWSCEQRKAAKTNKATARQKKAIKRLISDSERPPEILLLCRVLSNHPFGGKGEKSGPRRPCWTGNISFFSNSTYVCWIINININK